MQLLLLLLLLLLVLVLVLVLVLLRRRLTLGPVHRAEQRSWQTGKGTFV